MPKSQEYDLSAAQSEPGNFNWMQEHPPSNEDMISAKDGSYLEFPQLRWSTMNMQELMPTARIARKLSPPHLFSYDLDEKIDKITFLPWGEEGQITWKCSLAKNYTDGIVILHRGKIIYEKYCSIFDEAKMHAVFSVTKSFVGTLARILIVEGSIDASAEISHYIPELKSSGFGDATVQQVLDMTASIHYSENYEDPGAEVWAFSDAGNPLIKNKGDSDPVGFYAYLEKVKKEGSHGNAFQYKTVNAQVVGWILERATGQTVADLLTEKIWSKIGMEMDSAILVDAKGTAFSGGGLSAGLRDLARFGELMRNKGTWNGSQLFPQKVVDDIAEGGSKDNFAKSDHRKLKGWTYKDLWWITENENRAYTARGIYGQTIYIDPTAEMVIVRVASHPVAGNAGNDSHSLPAYEAVAAYLINKNL